MHDDDDVDCLVVRDLEIAPRSPPDLAISDLAISELANADLAIA